MRPASFSSSPRILGLRAALAARIAIACATTATAIACSDHAGLPDEPEGDRIFNAPPASLTSGSGSTFADLYRDIFNTKTGVARCQNLACHGGDKGQSGLAMHSGPEGVYRGITTHFYGDKKVVAPVYKSDTDCDTGGVAGAGDASVKSAILDVLDPSTGFMPRLSATVGNRKLNRQELARIDLWLKKGAPFDGLPAGSKTGLSACPSSGSFACVDLNADPLNCGTCGTVCKGADGTQSRCVAGKCAS